MTLCSHSWSMHYKDKCYRQIDGVTMGSPLGPTLANFCLSHFEMQLLHNCSNQSCHPALYLRYVDDIFCVFRSGSQHEQFLQKLNQMHPNLKFTSEIGPSSIAFLDTFISLPDTDNGKFTSKVFRKSTFTGLLLHFTAVCPKKWKFGLINCLLHRAYMISSNWKIFSDEICFLKDIFKQNGYPEDWFYSCVKKFLSKKHGQVEDRRIVQDKVETLFFIPYIGLPSVIFGRKLRDIFRRYYAIDIRIVFTSFKVRNYFSLKCRTPLPLLANVVYKFKCSCDTNKIYIGKTMRHLATRVREHGNSPSAINQHLTSCETCKRNFPHTCF